MYGTRFPTTGCDTTFAKSATPEAIALAMKKWNDKKELLIQTSIVSMNKWEKLIAAAEVLGEDERTEVVRLQKERNKELVTNGLTVTIPDSLRCDSCKTMAMACVLEHSSELNLPQLIICLSCFAENKLQNVIPRTTKSFSRPMITQNCYEKLKLKLILERPRE